MPLRKQPINRRRNGCHGFNARGLKTHPATNKSKGRGQNRKNALLDAIVNLSLD
jgi:hypothetical protein